MVAVHEYLHRIPRCAFWCIIDRETVVAATKFVLCRADWFKRYEERLLEAYRDNVWPLGADFEPHWCLVLSLDTRLADIFEGRAAGTLRSACTVVTPDYTVAVPESLP